MKEFVLNQLFNLLSHFNRKHKQEHLQKETFFSTIRVNTSTVALLLIEKLVKNPSIILQLYFNASVTNEVELVVRRFLPAVVCCLI